MSDGERDCDEVIYVPLHSVKGRRQCLSFVPCTDTEKLPPTRRNAFTTLHGEVYVEIGPTVLVRRDARALRQDPWVGKTLVILKQTSVA